MLGVVLDTSDADFDAILERGFAAAIRREWAWRTSRGDSVRNLVQFRHLDRSTLTTARLEVIEDQWEADALERRFGDTGVDDITLLKHAAGLGASHNPPLG